MREDTQCLTSGLKSASRLTNAATSAAHWNCGRLWVALSLGGLRRKIEIAMLPDDVRVVLQLDGLAERERHRRQA
jgi:hypothetical protein